MPFRPFRSIPSWSGEDWRSRANQLFTDSDQADSQIDRELLRRRAVAAQNIADAMDHNPAHAAESTARRATFATNPADDGTPDGVGRSNGVRPHT